MGRGAAACVNEFRTENVFRDAQLAYRRFLAQTPPEIREFLSQQCSGSITPKCLARSLKQTEQNFLNDEGFYELALQMDERYPGVFDPNEVTAAAEALVSANQTLSILTFACERVQGHVDIERRRYTSVDPSCHTQPDYSAVPGTFVGTTGPVGEGSLSDVAVDTDRWLSSRDPADANRPVDLGEWSSPLGLLESSCPDYISRYNSFRISGSYAVPCDADRGSITLANVYGRYVEEGLREILVRQLAEEELQITGSNLVLAVQATSSMTGITMDSLVEEVARSCSGDSASLARAFQEGVREGRAALREDLSMDDTLWTDIAGVVLQVEANAQVISQLETHMQQKCGAYAYDIGAAFVGATQEAACIELRAQHLRLIQHQDEAFRHYPFLAQRLAGGEAPLWSRMATALGLSADRKAQIVRGDVTLSSSETGPLRDIYNSALSERLGRTRDRIRTVCANPQAEGLRNLQNPLIVGSFFDRDPENQSAGWALCKAYADANLSEQRTDLIWTVGNIGTLFIPGIGIAGQITTRAMAFAAVGVAGASVLHTTNELQELRESTLRDEAHYLAEVGDVSRYLQARAAQDSFMSEAIQGGGLELLNVAVTGLQVIPALRGGAALLRLAESTGELNQTVRALGDADDLIRNYRPGSRVAFRSGDDWVTANVDEVLEGGSRIRVTDSRGLSRVLEGDTRITRESRYVRAVEETERTSERAVAQLTGDVRRAGREVYLPSHPSDTAPSPMVEARVGQSVYVTLPDGTRTSGILRDTVLEGESIRALRVEVPSRGLVDIHELDSVRVGRDTWVAPELRVEYRTAYNRWYQVFGDENAELLDKIIDIHTGRELMRDPTAMAEVVRLAGRVDLSQGLPSRVLRALGDRADQILARSRGRVSDEIQQLSRSCATGG
jgi:hypothetical protein